LFLLGLNAWFHSRASNQVPTTPVWIGKLLIGPNKSPKWFAVKKHERRISLERISLSINNNDAYAVSNPDMDPQETSEWLESLSQASATRGRGRARELMLNLLRRSHELQLNVPLVPTTDYINTIAPEDEPEFPGDEKIERTYRSWMRWNAAMLVHRAQRPGIAVGGHISTFASSASLYEVGFNHFFKGQDHPSGGDQIFVQGHASPGPYARAFLEGRLSENQLNGFRQEQ
jgi:pyruvate dehydrogenase E1 component